MPYAIRKVDDNQPEIVETLRRCGFSVACTHIIGKGFPDLAISKHGITMLAEVKDGRKRKSSRRLTGDEKTFRENWKAEIPILETEDDVLALSYRFTRMLVRL
jgi:hypothetical protein